MKPFLNSRKFRHGSLATAITLVTLALLVVANLIAAQLDERYDLRCDLTPNKAFALSGDSVAFLDSLQKDVKIYILATEDQFTAAGEYFVQAGEVIKRYARQSDRVTVEYVDILADPTFIARFPDLQLASLSILVTCGDKATTVSPYDLFHVEYGYYGESIASSKAEQTMTSTLMNLTSDKVLTVSVLSGYGETRPDAFLSLLELNGYRVAEQNILTEDVAPEAAVAIIACPERDWAESDIRKLDRFLENGGDKGKTLLYFSHLTQPDNLPNLSAFLADWGIAVGGGAVLEMNPRAYINQSSLYPLVQYMEETFAERSIRRGTQVVVPEAKPLASIPTGTAISSGVLLQFTESSLVYPPSADGNWTPADAEITGPIPAAVMGTDIRAGDGADVRSNVVAVGSMTALDSAFLSHTSLANSSYFLDLTDILCGRTETVPIESKTVGGARLGLNVMQANLLSLVMMVAVPLLVLAAGIAVWLRRRHL